MTKSIYLVSYFLPNSNEKAYKIGYTKRDVNKRVKELKTGNPNELMVEKVYEASNYSSNIERSLHREFKSKKMDGEWFLLSNEDVDNFEYLCEKYYKMFDLMQTQNTYVMDKNINFK